MRIYSREKRIKNVRTGYAYAGNLCNGTGYLDRNSLKFFVGLHMPSMGHKFNSVCISRNRLLTRKKPIGAKAWMMDSGAFSIVSRYGGYPEPVDVYAELIRRWSHDKTLKIAVSEDYMCEKHILEKTGNTILEHQLLTTERYDSLLKKDTGCVPIMPVLQGYSPEDYVSHIKQYGKRLTYGMWVGVGSVCKRNGSPQSILDVLTAIKKERPDLRLHGFGIKTTSLRWKSIRDKLESADSMAWSFNARFAGRNANCWKEAKMFTDNIDALLLEDIFS